MKNIPPIIPPVPPQIVYVNSPFRRPIWKLLACCFVLFTLIPMIEMVFVSIHRMSQSSMSQPTAPKNAKQQIQERWISNLVAEQKNQERWISNLVTEINHAQGAEREAKLRKLLALDPDTKEFPDEISRIRKLQRELDAAAEDFLRNGIGKRVPYGKWGVFGMPNTLEGTGSKYWVAYLPTIDAMALR